MVFLYTDSVNRPTEVGEGMHALCPGFQHQISLLSLSGKGQQQLEKTLRKKRLRLRFSLNAIRSSPKNNATVSDPQYTVRSPRLLTVWEDRNILFQRQRAVDSAALRSVVRTICSEKWLDPLLLFQGEIVEMALGDRIMKTFTFQFFAMLFKGKLPTHIKILKRGYSISELLRRSSRTLNHDVYINCYVQQIYGLLSPGIRNKTDVEWIQRRLRRRARALAKILQKVNVAENYYS
mmetsp:Transcript_19021/g.38450  ORF Transcript_19021/g.38450 Transcript_19021/m.38450 type:complete len:235 (+) Transcript_19021:34-738(+)